MGEAEAVAEVQVDREDWGSCLRVPGGRSADQTASHLQPHRPHLPVEETEVQSGSPGDPKHHAEAGGCPGARKARSLRRTWEPGGDGRHACNLPLSDLLGNAVVDTHVATLEPEPGYASGQLGPVQVGVGGAVKLLPQV